MLFMDKDIYNEHAIFNCSPNGIVAEDFGHENSTMFKFKISFLIKP